MNQTTAAKYLNVSVSTFKRLYLPHLRKKEEGGVIYFLKNDIEKYCRSRFITSFDSSTPLKNTASKASNAYQDALKKVKG